MNKTKQNFFKSSICYLLGNILSKVVIVFLLPLYTHFISPEDYGRYDLYVAFCNFFSSVLFGEIWIGTMRFMIEEKEIRRKYAVVSSSLAVYSVSVLLYLATFSLFNLFMDIRCFPLVLTFGLMITVQNFFLFPARALGKNILVAVSGFVSTCVMVLMNVILITVFHMGYSSLFIGSISGMLVQTVILERSVRFFRHLSFRLTDRTTVRKLVFYCLPYCLNSAAYWFLTGFNSVTVTGWISPEQNGYYAIANKFSAAVNLVGTCFSLAWQEAAFAKSSESSSQGRFYSRATDLYIKLVLCGLTVIVPAAAVAFPVLVGSEYTFARRIVPLSLMGAAANLFSLFLGNIFGAVKQTKYIFVSTAVSCVVNVGLLLALIDPLKAQAAALSLTVGFSVSSVIRMVLLHKLIGLKVDLLRLGLYSLPLVAVCVIYYLFGTAINAVALSAAVAYVCIVCRHLIRDLFRMVKGRLFRPAVRA